MIGRELENLGYKTKYGSSTWAQSTVIGIPKNEKYKGDLLLGKTLEQNEVLEEFDRYVFESIVEKVIVGGINEDGNKGPAQLTFVYKTGLKNSVDGDKFKPQRKNARGRHRTDKLCSNVSDEVENMCSACSDSTYLYFGDIVFLCTI